MRIGTSGWHYPTGRGSWNGIFYPKPRPRGFDDLTFYAEYFDAVEVNATFYGQPRPDVTAQWAERTPPGFVFAVKLYQQFTHPTLYQARVKDALARALGTTEVPEAAVAALITANQADLDAFKRGIDPLAAAGKLGALLAQFPASFRDTPANRIHLASLLRAFGEHGGAVELRHRSWSDHAEETRRLLDAFHAAWVWIDEPKFKDSIRQPDIEAGAFVYARLHGRNAKQWWRGDNIERYDYLYTTEELQPIADRIKGKRGFTFLNNHANAKAIANATQIKAMLEQTTGRLPETMTAAYPSAVTHPRTARAQP